MELNCEFYNHKSVSSDETSYICRVTGFGLYSSSGRIIDIFGTHLEGKSNINVDTFIIVGHQIETFPRFLCHFFPNLKSISVIECGLKSLRKSDLSGCEGIQKLMLNGNVISTIESNVFENTPNLENISFYNNWLSFDILPENIFDGLKKLKSVNFEKNTGIDWCCRETAKGNFLYVFKKKLINKYRYIETPKVSSGLSDLIYYVGELLDMDLLEVERMERQENYRREVMKLYNLL